MPAGDIAYNPTISRSTSRVSARSDSNRNVKPCSSGTSGAAVSTGVGTGSAGRCRTVVAGAFAAGLGTGRCSATVSTLFCGGRETSGRVSSMVAWDGGGGTASATTSASGSGAGAGVGVSFGAGAGGAGSGGSAAVSALAIAAGDGAREGAADELDLDATIDGTAKQGWLDS